MVLHEAGHLEQLIEVLGGEDDVLVPAVSGRAAPGSDRWFTGSDHGPRIPQLEKIERHKRGRRRTGGPGAAARPLSPYEGAHSGHPAEEGALRRFETRP